MSERIYYSNEARERARREQTLLALIAVALGTGVGALVMLMLAPRSGEETRRTLGDQTSTLFENGRKAVEQVIGSVQHAGN